MTTTKPEGRSAFFYGTLMAPQVLHRVCHGGSQKDNPLYQMHNLKTYPAILHNHRRHRVRLADYPAITPHDGASVRGTYVTGLTDADIWRLDIFEGSQYVRGFVKPRLLTKVGNEDGEGNEEGEEVDAETYIWGDDADELEEAEWDFVEFQREKMRYWVGDDGESEYSGRPSIVEVDEAVAEWEREQQRNHDGTGGRGANGEITKALEESRKEEVVRNAV